MLDFVVTLTKSKVMNKKNAFIVAVKKFRNMDVCKVSKGTVAGLAENSF